MKFNQIALIVLVATCSAFQLTSAAPLDPPHPLQRQNAASDLHSESNGGGLTHASSDATLVSDDHSAAAEPSTSTDHHDAAAAGPSHPPRSRSRSGRRRGGRAHGHHQPALARQDATANLLPGAAAPVRSDSGADLTHDDHTAVNTPQHSRSSTLANEN